MEKHTACPKCGAKTTQVVLNEKNQQTLVCSSCGNKSLILLDGPRVFDNGLRLDERVVLEKN